MNEFMSKASQLGHDMREPRRSDIAHAEPRGGMYSTCKRCGRSVWEKPDLQGGHGTAPTHRCVTDSTGSDATV